MSSKVKYSGMSAKKAKSQARKDGWRNVESAREGESGERILYSLGSTGCASTFRGTSNRVSRRENTTRVRKKRAFLTSCDRAIGSAKMIETGLRAPPPHIHCTYLAEQTAAFSANHLLPLTLSSCLHSSLIVKLSRKDTYGL